MRKLVVALLLVSASSLFASDGAAIYKKCAGCHGMKAEKKALGKSLIVSAMSQADIEKAINGYKDGTYGGPMKALMKGQVANLNATQVSAVAAYIKSL